MDNLKRNLPIILVLVAGAALFYFVLRRPAKTLEYGATDDQEALELVTLLPRDAIPAIDEPLFHDADEADLEYAPDALVLGVSRWSTPALAQRPYWCYS